MTHENTDKCASCESFPIKDAAEGDGSATCEWFGPMRWSERACVLYNRDKEGIKDRKQWVLRLIEKEKKTT